MALIPDTVAVSPAAPAIFSVVPDSMAADSLKVEPRWGVTLSPPPAPLPQAPRSSFGSSVIVVILLVAFVIMAVKIKNSSRFMASLWKDLTSVRERHSLFDNTVRETSLLVFLIIATVISGGMLLAACFCNNSPRISFPFLNALHLQPFVLHNLVSILLMAAYFLFMWIAYNLSGRVFESENHTRLWLRGFTASMALLSFIWLPLAMISISHPEWTASLALIAIISFILAKLAFIWKGFRIFFTKGASWLLFLYYLCSLELVPVILLLSAVKAAA